MKKQQNQNPSELQPEMGENILEQGDNSLEQGENLIEREENLLEQGKEVLEYSIPEIDKNLEAQLLEIDHSIIKKSKTSKSLTKTQVSQVLARIQVYKGIQPPYVLLGVTTLLRKGAANAGASDNLKVELQIPGTDKSVEINRYDIVMAMIQIVGHKNVRKLAEAMAPEMLVTNLIKVKKNPILDLKGDLANRINRKLFLRKEEPLTREEEICCCTYAQWMPNLNELANSKRLKGLLEEDLNARRKRQEKKSYKKGKK